MSLASSVYSAFRVERDCGIVISLLGICARVLSSTFLCLPCLPTALLISSVHSFTLIQLSFIFTNKNMDDGNGLCYCSDNSIVGALSDKKEKQDIGVHESEILEEGLVAGGKHYKFL